MIQKSIENVRLRGYPNGIQIIIKEDALLGDILCELSDKFKNGDRFFKNAQIAVCFLGRKNTPDEEEAMINVIHEACNVKIACIMSNEENPRFNDVLSLSHDLKLSDIAQIYRGNLCNREIYECEQNIIVFGDVESGSIITSMKSIIVLGTLSGSAFAGKENDNPQGCFVAALHMDPETIKIGNLRGRYKKKKGFGSKKTPDSLLAYCNEDTIEFDNFEFTKELLRKFI